MPGIADAARTALEVIRRERGGDLRGVAGLVTTYGDVDKALIIGMLASVINHTLAAIDELAVSHVRDLTCCTVLAGVALLLSHRDHEPSCEAPGDG